MQPSQVSLSINSKFESLVIGQPDVAPTIMPFVELFEAGLSPMNRPIGVFLLLGPTGTGKTRSVEALAEVVHGTSRHVLRVDCGEYQNDHEVAKLIGSPPGYLGHRETQPLLSQARLNAVASERSRMSIVLFDEIEKAAPSMMRMLLGVLDRGILRLGDNNLVNFENCIIFMTSNLGADRMQQMLKPSLGLGASVAEPPALDSLKSVGLAAAKRKFSPEFMNRIDAIITYKPLAREDMGRIFDLELTKVRLMISHRLGGMAYELTVSPALKEHILDMLMSPEYGARELKRLLHRCVLMPLAHARHQMIEGIEKVELDKGSSEDKILVRLFHEDA